MAPAPLVLVVEEDLDVLESICDALELEGYRVERARSGTEGLEHLRRSRPAVILVDPAMPGVGGAAFAAELQALGRGDVPIVVVSSDGNPRHATRIGAQGYLAKPFDVRALLTQVASMTSMPGEPGP
jgi:CheY-like chemotaxis protein